MTLQRRAFTLIELLTVIAITAVLMTVIVIPIVDSFNLLHAGQGWSEAQERARLLLDKIARELSVSSGVRPNEGIGGQIAVVVPSGPGSADATVTELLSFAKIDILKPAEGEPQVDASGNPVFIDPISGKVDPTLHSPKGQALVPAAPGSTLVRYWIGLRQPFSGTVQNPVPATYNNPYDGLLMQRNTKQDNLFVLYRAEVQPFVFNGGKVTPNTTYFDTDASGNIILDDPEFFVLDPNRPNLTRQATRIQAWQQIAVMQTEVSRYDMVLPAYNKSNRNVVFDAVTVNGNTDYAPRLVPLMQFRPTHITNETAEQMRTVRIGEESDNSAVGGADVIRTQKGEWSNAFVRTYPVPLNGSLNPAGLPYLVGRNGPRSDGSTGFSIFQFDPTTGGDDTTAGIELFDFTTFANDISTGSSAYPFSDAIRVANGRTGWLATQAYRDLFSPYQPDTAAGQLLASFGIDEVGITTNGITLPNLPLDDSGLPQTPAQWLKNGGTTAVWSGPGYTINDAFNYAWNTYGNLLPNLQRFIDLRVTPNQDGTYGPLFPDSSTNISGANVVISGNSRSFARATIVPGSDKIWGPDQTPGPNLGNQILYTRTTQEPGPNQYRINYVHQPEPADYTALGLTVGNLAGFNPAVYDPTNFVSAVIQARYMPGYIEFNSDPNVPLDSRSQGVPFKIYYRFQFTNPSDSYAVDYDSRQAIALLLTLHDFPQTSLPNPQTMTLKTTATVRNFLR